MSDRAKITALVALVCEKYRETPRSLIIYDSKTKLITVLVYMNGRWEAPGGRLRLLRTPDSLDHAITEVPPDEGTLLAFKVTGNSWHGHEPFVGERRVIQLNWVTGTDVVQHEQRRHRLTAKIKKFLPFS